MPWWKWRSGINTLNFMGSVHGGALFTLADVAAGTAMIAHGHTCVTLNSTLSFIKPALSGRVPRRCQELHNGSRIGVMEVSVEDERFPSLHWYVYHVYHGLPGRISEKHDIKRTFWGFLFPFGNLRPFAPLCPCRRLAARE